MRSSGRFTAALILFLAGRLAPIAGADTIALTPSADTTLIEFAPTNNLGGALHFSSGGAGDNSGYKRNRALLRFDLTGLLPAGSTVTRVTLTLNMTGQPRDEFASSCFDLHRMLRPWGEGVQTGTSSSPGRGEGVVATTNEATWQYRFAFTTNTWAAPGGLAGVDYSPVTSSSQAIYDVGSSPYLFNSTPAFVADVQAWVNDPVANFGWIFLSEAEGTAYTVRRFGSREDVDNAPLLEVEFTAPPALRIDTAEIFAQKFQLRFQASAGQTYAVEFREAFAAGHAWQTLTNLPAPTAMTNLTVTDDLGPAQRFYRLRTP